jgi:hypothetical protein
MYGLSSIPFSHARYFDERDRTKGLPLWETRFERDYDIAIPAEGSLRPVGEKIMKDAGLEGAFGVYRQGPNQIHVYIYTFWKSTQLKYLVAEKKLVAEDRRFRFEHFLTGMHARGGFEQGGLQNLWSWIVDLVCLAMVLWVVTGLVMWWRLQQRRTWGWVALFAGAASFCVLLWVL